MAYRVIKENKQTGDKKIFGCNSYYIAKQIHDSLIENDDNSHFVFIESYEVN